MDAIMDSRLVELKDSLKEIKKYDPPQMNDVMKVKMQGLVGLWTAFATEFAIPISSAEAPDDLLGFIQEAADSPGAGKHELIKVVPRVVQFANAYYLATKEERRLRANAAP